MEFIPKQIIFEYNLYPYGKFELAYPQERGGMKAGIDPRVGRIIIPKDFGLYPDGWFPIQREKSIIKIKSEFESSHIIDQDGSKKYFLPQWIQLDCYRYFWEKLHWEKTEK